MSEETRTNTSVNKDQIQKNRTNKQSNIYEQLNKKFPNIMVEGRNAHNEGEVVVLWDHSSEVVVADDHNHKDLDEV